jgi:hypothetical protein
VGKFIVAPAELPTWLMGVLFYRPCDVDLEGPLHNGCAGWEANVIVNMGLKNRSAMMNELETQSRPPVGQLQGTPAAKTNVGTQVGKCLIVSTDIAKRETISLAATEAGWDTIVCADEASAMKAVLRNRFQMAWIDLDGSPACSAARELCQAVAALSQVLLVVCGHEHDAEEETWARQLGVWLYLPGLSLDHPRELCEVCEQAQWVAGRSGVRS